MLKFESINVSKPDEVNVILGQSHFIKTVEDVYEAMVNAVPEVRFGLAFSEASGACKIRCEGNDAELKELSAKNALAIGAGHTFIIMMKNAYPLNVLNALKNIPEVCTLYCATANSLEVIIAETKSGRGIMGVIDGSKPIGVEQDTDIAWRKQLLRKIGYKL